MPPKKGTKKKLRIVDENIVISHEPQISDDFERDEEYLKKYLSSIKNSTGGFKRVTLSPLRYAGGKSNAVGLILDNLPKLKEKKVVSPFFGGGSFELVLSSVLGYQVIGYDIFGMLTNFWDQAITNPVKLADSLQTFSPKKENYTRYRHILLNYWDKIKPETLIYNTREKLELTEHEKVVMDNDKTLQAAYYYYNMQLSYGPMFLGWPSSVYLDDQDKYNKIVKKIRDFKPGNLIVKCDVFENVIKAHSDDFLFVDPPYYLNGDSKMFKGMYPNCNFAIHHNSFNHEALRDLLKSHKGGFLITYNDCSTIREWYKDFKQVFPKWQYTYGQGETRIGKNREETTKDNVKESHEIFIVCHPM
jgi:DNA adenine methylase